MSLINVGRSIGALAAVALIVGALLATFDAERTQETVRADGPTLVRVGMLGGRVRAVAVIPSAPGGAEHVLIGHEDRVLMVPGDAEGRLIPSVALELPDIVRDITVAGSRAYAALESAGLAIIDVSDPAAPALIALLALPGKALAVGVPDDGGEASWLAVAAGAAGVHLVDVSDPALPVLSGTLSTRRDAVDVVARGATVVVAESSLLEGVLRIVDVTDISAPIERSLVDLGAGARTVAFAPPRLSESADIDGPIVFAAGDSGAVWSIGLADLDAPERLGALTAVGGLPGDVDENPARDMAVAPGIAGGDALFVAIGDGGIRVVNIDDPERMSSTARRTLSGPASALAIGRGGWRTHVALDTGGLAVIDSRARNRLPELGRWDLVGRAVGVALDGDHAWVADAFGWARGVDVSDPTAPFVGGLHEVAEGEPRAITALGGYVFIGTEVSPQPVEGGGPGAFEDRGGIDIAWVREPTAPIAALSFEPRRTFSAVSTAGTWLFAAEESEGLPEFLDPPLALRAFDMRNPLRPSDRSAFALPDNPTGVAVAGGVAYVTVADTGMVTIDTSDPMEPVGIGGVRTPGEALGVRSGDGYVYVADGDWGVTVVDVADPSYPAVVGTVDTAGSARAVAYDGRWIWVADGQGGVRLIDVLDPANPRDVANVSVPGNAVSIAVRGEYGYVTDEEGWLVIVRLEGVERGPEVTPSPTVVLPSPVPTVTLTPGPTVSATATAAPTASREPVDGIYLPTSWR